MIKKLSVAFLALFVLAGCSSSHRVGNHSNLEGSLVSEFERQAGDRVFFSYDSSDLSATSKEQLNKQITWLAAHPQVKVTIEGHCDERGTRDYNLALGERRAEAVARFLKNNGLDASKIETISYGKERPFAIGNDEEAWKQNRRAVTTLRY